MGGVRTWGRGSGARQSRERRVSVVGSGERRCGKVVAGKFQLAFIIIIRCGEGGLEVLVGFVYRRFFTPGFNVVGENSGRSDGTNSCIEDLLVGEGSLPGFSKGNGVGDALKERFDRKRRVKGFGEAFCIFLQVMFVNVCIGVEQVH